VAKARLLCLLFLSRTYAFACRERFGQFHTGDSYILLHTFKAGDKIAYDVHFWLGAETSQDEAGTAALKTVELDDALGQVPVQHREVQDYESPLFLSYFNKTGGIRILAGGVDTGFNRVKPNEYKVSTGDHFRCLV
jgi:hypothetical protein